MSPAGSNKRAQNGFTLLELLVTLALATLLLSLVPPLLGKGGDRARLDHDTRLLTDSLRLARSRAIAGDREVAVKFDPEANRFGIDGVERPLSRGVAATVETPADEPGIFRFYPDGSASGAAIRLSNESGSRFLTIDWLTGAVELRP